jgi:hypothetical protein
MLTGEVSLTNRRKKPRAKYAPCLIVGYVMGRGITWDAAARRAAAVADIKTTGGS